MQAVLVSIATQWQLIFISAYITWSLWGRLTHWHPHPTWTLAESCDTAMFSWGPRPPNNSQISPHPHEVVRVLNTITEILAASAEINRRDKVYPFCVRQLNTYQFVNCRSNSREETRVYLPLRWTKYLPSQNLYGKKLCRSLYPPSHHFTSP